MNYLSFIKYLISLLAFFVIMGISIGIGYACGEPLIVPIIIGIFICIGLYVITGWGKNLGE